MTSRARWVVAVVAVLVLAATLRGLWLTADPSSNHTVGVVWHDEGAWVHNARNQVLWGTWRTDEWNPMFIAPVFTALEAAAFETFGVGTWQARTVPLASGLIAILALMWGLSAVAGRRAALMGGLLLATSYTFVMWNRAALMESTMTMFIVIGWAAYARSARRPMWGMVAGIAVVLAFFTKAAAAFFVAAIVLEMATAAILTIRDRSGTRIIPRIRDIADISGISDTSAISATFMGLVLATAAALVLFVAPNWSEFQFYNWAMTVERKPEYTAEAFARNATWLPLVHGVFSRMWLVMVVAGVAAVGIVTRWRSAHRAERLAVLWLLVGLVELVVHDSGNERRYVMFVPALVALASMGVARRDAVRRNELGGEIRSSRSEFASELISPAIISSRWLVAPIVAALAYLVFGSGLRLIWLDDILASNYGLTVRASAAVSVMLAALVWWRWKAWAGPLATGRLPPAAAAAVVLITCATDLTLYARWAASRSFHNYDTSRALGALLPSGTLVHGKLANGLALENQIKPLFVGRGFGNYADRLERNDARYILTYTQPELGLEGDVILDVLEHYPGKRTLAEFNVAAFTIDTTAGINRAALIDKFPDGPESRARNQ